MAQDSSESCALSEVEATAAFDDAVAFYRRWEDRYVVLDDMTTPVSNYAVRNLVKRLFALALRDARMKELG
jgi:hypothetical protein